MSTSLRDSTLRNSFSPGKKPEMMMDERSKRQIYQLQNRLEAKARHEQALAEGDAAGMASKASIGSTSQSSEVSSRGSSFARTQIVSMPRGDRSVSERALLFGYDTHSGRFPTRSPDQCKTKAEKLADFDGALAALNGSLDALERQNEDDNKNLNPLKQRENNHLEQDRGIKILESEALPSSQSPHATLREELSFRRKKWSELQAKLRPTQDSDYLPESQALRSNEDQDARIALEEAEIAYLETKKKVTVGRFSKKNQTRYDKLIERQLQRNRDIVHAHAAECEDAPKVTKPVDAVVDSDAYSATIRPCTSKGTTAAYSEPDRTMIGRSRDWSTEAVHRAGLDHNDPDPCGEQSSLGRLTGKNHTPTAFDYTSAAEEKVKSSYAAVRADDHDDLAKARAIVEDLVRREKKCGTSVQEEEKQVVSPPQWESEQNISAKEATGRRLYERHLLRKEAEEQRKRDAGEWDLLLEGDEYAVGASYHLQKPEEAQVNRRDNIMVGCWDLFERHDAIFDGAEQLEPTSSTVESTSSQLLKDKMTSESAILDLTLSSMDGVVSSDQDVDDDWVNLADDSTDSDCAQSPLSWDKWYLVGKGTGIVMEARRV